MISHRPATTLRRRGQMKFISYKTHGGAGSSPADDSFSHKILSANFEAQITSKNQENFFFVNLGYVGFKEPEKYFYHLRIFTCIFNFCTVFTARSAKFIKLSSFFVSFLYISIDPIPSNSTKESNNLYYTSSRVFIPQIFISNCQISGSVMRLF